MITIKCQTGGIPLAIQKGVMHGQPNQITVVGKLVIIVLFLVEWNHILF